MRIAVKIGGNVPIINGMRVLFLTFISLAIALGGCSTVNKVHVPPEQPPSAGERKTISEEDRIRSILYAQYREWKSVRYRPGGLSKKGIDCSGFVFITFREKLGIELPRTTELQSRAGTPLSRERLKAGDLVFFKTGHKVRHVGIFIEHNRFLHTSSSSGVMISSLDNPYWSKRFWKSVRIRG